MANMAKRSKDVDPMAEIEKAAALYERYVELSGIASIETVSKKPMFTAPNPAPMTITMC